MLPHTFVLCNYQAKVINISISSNIYYVFLVKNYTNLLLQLFEIYIIVSYGH